MSPASGPSAARSSGAPRPRFGLSFQSMLRRGGYTLVSEFVTPESRPAVRLRELSSQNVIVMYHSDAVELARGAVTLEAILFRNRAVF